MNLFGHKVNQLGRKFSKNLNEKISIHGLHASQWKIVLYLNEKKQCTQVELSNYLGVEAPTITRTLSKMEEAGWILRKEGKDKRERNIELTKKAYEMYPIWNEASKDIERCAVKNIDKNELEIFNKILEKMMKNLD